MLFQSCATIALNASIQLAIFCRFVALRLDNFVVGLTNDNPATSAPVLKSSYTLCAQYNGSVALSENATVVCTPSSQKFRYVIVQGSHPTQEAICLNEVAVYALRRKSQLHSYCNS